MKSTFFNLPILFLVVLTIFIYSKDKSAAYYSEMGYFLPNSEGYYPGRPFGCFYNANWIIISGEFIEFTKPIKSGLFGKILSKYEGDAYGLVVKVDSVIQSHISLSDTIEVFDFKLKGYNRKKHVGPEKDSYYKYSESVSRIYLVLFETELLKDSKNRKRLRISHDYVTYARSILDTSTNIFKGCNSFYKGDFYIILNLCMLSNEKSEIKRAEILREYLPIFRCIGGYYDDIIGIWLKRYVYNPKFRDELTNLYIKSKNCSGQGNRDSVICSISIE